MVKSGAAKKTASMTKKQKDPRNTGKSALNLKLDSMESRKGFDAMWNDAAHAPIFCRSKKVPGSDGKMKTVRRTARLISSMAFKIAASGAALNAKAVLGKECSEVRVTPRSELSHNPWLPSVTDGACIMLEQFVAAVAQEAAERAHVYREGCGTAMRLNRAYAKMGWDATVQSVFASSMPVPRAVFILPADKKTKNKKHEEDAEYSPLDEEEQNPAPQGEEADIAGGD